tara:strand:- start:185 stop:502 length:318 start_codon:yes stop_codon:yes gene_type:complete
MIKMKQLMEGKFSYNRKFGEPLPTLKDFAKNNAEETVNEETLTEGNIKVIPEDKITSKVWRRMKYDLRDQFDELVKVGEDYGVFQNAQGTAKSLKQIKRILDKIN